MKIRNRWLGKSCGVVLLSLGACIAGAGLAQPYPSKNIRIIVGFPPGGTADFVARILGQNLATAFGQQVIVDNRLGAGGNIATELASKAPPDGYTLLLAAATHVINPSLYRNAGYDAVKDFAPITLVAGGVQILVVHPSVPVKNIKEFIALAKSRQGGIVYASSGIGTPSHLAMELLKTLAGFDTTHVPYKGTGPQMIDLIAGQVGATFVAPLGAVPNVKNGKVRAIAVASLRRTALLPEVPTIAESGFPGYEANSWQGLLAPAGAPREVVARLYEEVSAILKLPDIRERMIANGAEVVGTGSTPDEFAAYIQAEMMKWSKVIKQSGARAD